MVVLDVLRSLEGHEDRPERRGAQQEPQERPTSAFARGVDRQCHRPGARQQDGRVDGAQRQVRPVRGPRELRAVGVGGRSVADEGAAEEDQLGRQEDPHPERGGLPLLERVVELEGHVGARGRHVIPSLPPDTRRALPSRWGSPGSCAAEAATGSAIPGRRRSRGWSPRASRT